MRKRTYLTISCIFACLTQSAWATPEDADLASLKAELAANSDQSSGAKSASIETSEAQMERQNKELLDQEAALLKKISIDQSSPATEAKASVKLDSESKTTTIKASDDETVDFGEPSSDSIQKSPETKEARLALPNPDISKLESDNSSLRRRLNSTESQLASLRKELDKVKGQRMLAETEVERLSRVLEERDRAGLVSSRILSSNSSNSSSTNIASRAKLGTRSLSHTKEERFTEPAQPERVQTGDNKSSALVTTRPVEDVQVATVVSPKAYLRTGPGTENSPLMAVTEGTRLVVETRRGGWYRVVSPTGTRAWVASSVLSFSPFAGDKSSGSTLRLKGVDSSLDAASRSLADKRL